MVFVDKSDDDVGRTSLSMYGRSGYTGILNFCQNINVGHLISTIGACLS